MHSQLPGWTLRCYPPSTLLQVDWVVVSEAAEAAVKSNAGGKFASGFTGQPVGSDWRSGPPVATAAGARALECGCSMRENAALSAAAFTALGLSAFQAPRSYRCSYPC